MAFDDRRAFIVRGEFDPGLDRVMAVWPYGGIPMLSGDKLTLGERALVFAREMSVKKLGPVKIDSAGRPVPHSLDAGCFAVRSVAVDNDMRLIVEGPMDARGNLPDWGCVLNRKPVPVEPGVVELIAEDTP